MFYVSQKEKDGRLRVHIVRILAMYLLYRLFKIIRHSSEMEDGRVKVKAIDPIFVELCVSFHGKGRETNCWEKFFEKSTLPGYGLRLSQKTNQPISDAGTSVRQSQAMLRLNNLL